jgi:dihydrofolate reductase
METQIKKAPMPTPEGKCNWSMTVHNVNVRLNSESIKTKFISATLGKTVRQLKQAPGKGLFVGGVKLPLALAELGLIDEYLFVVQPRLAGHGPTLFAGLSKPLDLKLVDRQEFGSGAVALRYEPNPLFL